MHLPYKTRLLTSGNKGLDWYNYCEHPNEKGLVGREQLPACFLPCTEISREVLSYKRGN